MTVVSTKYIGYRKNLIYLFFDERRLDKYIY
jgi:hypothetical protein